MLTLSLSLYRPHAGNGHTTIFRRSRLHSRALGIVRARLSFLRRTFARHIALARSVYYVRVRTEDTFDAFLTWRVENDRRKIPERSASAVINSGTERCFPSLLPPPLKILSSRNAQLKNYGQSRYEEIDAELVKKKKRRCRGVTLLCSSHARTALRLDAARITATCIPETRDKLLIPRARRDAPRALILLFSPRRGHESITRVKLKSLDMIPRSFSL